MKYLLSFLILITSLFSYGAAYTPDVGDGIIILGARSYSADEIFDEDRVKQSSDNDSTFSRLQLEYFWEHGLLPKISLFAFGTIFGQVKIDEKGNDRESTSSGNHEVGLKYNYALSDDWRRSIQLSTSFPLYPRSGDPLIGNHQHDLELRHLWDDISNTFLSFETFELAYRFRLDQPADEVKVGYTAGLSSGLNTIFFQGFLTYGLRNHDGSAESSNTNLSSNFDQLVFGLNYARDLNEHWTAQVGYFRDIWGRSVSAGDTLIFSIWKKY